MIELDAAIEKLKAHGGYDWLLTGPAFWSVKQVVDALAQNGRQVSVSTMTRRFHELPHTSGSYGPGGLSASKNDLIIMFGSEMGQTRRRLD